MGNLSRALTYDFVYLGGSGAAETNLRVLEVTNRVGSSGLSTARVEVDNRSGGSFGALQGPSLLSNVSLRDLYTHQQIEIKLGGTGETIFLGIVVGLRAQITERGETVELVCRQDPFMFGAKTRLIHRVAKLETGAVPVLPTAFDVVLSDYVAVLNPYIRGVPTPNMYLGESGPGSGSGTPSSGTSGEAGDTFPAFMDPDSMDRAWLDTDRQDGEEGLEDAGTTARFWDIRHAVQYFCKLLNASEEYFLNPTWGELFGFDDTALIRNFAVPTNAYLPDILTSLLRPLGFDWRVHYPDTPGKPQIKVYKIEDQTAKTVKLQAWGADTDYDESEICRFNLSFDGVSRSFNLIHGIGAFQKFQTTVLLYPAWDSAYDEYPNAPLNWKKLTKDDDSWLTEPELRYAWRRFVCNEGGEYTASRDWFPSAVDLNLCAAGAGSGSGAGGTGGAFKYYKRRRPLAMLTTDEEGEPIGTTPPGVIVEYYDVISQSWHPLDSKDNGFRFSVLQDELGIIITSSNIPVLLTRMAKAIIGSGSAGSGASVFDLSLLKLRMTCTIESDSVIRGIAFDTSPLVSDTLEWIYDRQKEYDYSEIINCSVHTGNYDRETDGLTALSEKAIELLQVNKQGDLSGTLTLEGLDRAAQSYLGYRIQKIAGREIDFSTHPGSSGGTGKYPYVTGVSYRPQRQEVDLELETVRPTLENVGARRR